MAESPEAYSALYDIALSLQRVAAALEKKEREPVFIFVPSNTDPEQLREMGKTIKDALNG